MATAAPHGTYRDKPGPPPLVGQPPLSRHTPPTQPPTHTIAMAGLPAGGAMVLGPLVRTRRRPTSTPPHHQPRPGRRLKAREDAVQEGHPPLTHRPSEAAKQPAHPDPHRKDQSGQLPAHLLGTQLRVPSLPLWMVPRNSPTYSAGLPQIPQRAEAAAAGSCHH